MDPLETRVTAVVVGAGVAGLTAARTLRQQGIDTLVVEASDVVGGRVKQVDGILPWPVELGPEFVHGAKSSLKVLRWLAGVGVLAPRRRAHQRVRIHRSC